MYSHAPLHSFSNAASKRGTPRRPERLSVSCAAFFFFAFFLEDSISVQLLGRCVDEALGTLSLLGVSLQYPPLADTNDSDARYCKYLS